MIFTALLLLTSSGYNRKTTIAGVLSIFFLIFFLGSKFSILVFFITLATTIAYLLRRFPFWRALVLLSYFILFSIIVLALFFKTDLFRTLSNSIRNRIHLYKSSFFEIKENFFVGVGNYNIKNVLSKYSIDSNLAMDTHNLFIQEFLANGVFGLLTVLGFMFLLFKKAKNDYIFFMFTLVFLLIGMVEHVLNLQLGVTFFVFFSFLFFYSNKTERTIS
ncbi:O-antigen ligase family protein [Flagellimonas sp. S3867]|uniref:O-antigen ligase family protein n=1 Tax=Flagellimonas sp. S3867 TaxID=2768063 RepID=UPI001CC2663A